MLPQTRRTPVDEVEILDPVQLAALDSIGAANGVSLFQELVQTLRRDMPERLAAITAACAAPQEGTNLISKAHALAGSCGALGARQLQAACLRLEALARNGQWAAVPAQLESMRVAWQKLDRALTRKIQGVDT